MCISECPGHVRFLSRDQDEYPGAAQVEQGPLEVAGLVGAGTGGASEEVPSGTPVR